MRNDLPSGDPFTLYAASISAALSGGDLPRARGGIAKLVQYANAVTAEIGEASEAEAARARRLVLNL